MGGGWQCITVSLELKCDYFRWSYEQAQKLPLVRHMLHGKKYLIIGTFADSTNTLAIDLKKQILVPLPSRKILSLVQVKSAPEFSSLVTDSALRRYVNLIIKTKKVFVLDHPKGRQGKEAPITYAESCGKDLKTKEDCLILHIDGVGSVIGDVTYEAALCSGLISSMIRR